MESERRRPAVEHASPIRSLHQQDVQPARASTLDAVPGALHRQITGSPVVLAQAAILGLQRAVGNRAVQRMLSSRVQRQPTGSAATATAKTQEQEEELALSKILGQEEELALSKSLAPDASLTEPQPGSDEFRKDQDGGCGLGCGCVSCAAVQEIDVPIGQRISRAAINWAGPSAATSGSWTLSPTSMLRRATLVVAEADSPGEPVAVPERDLVAGRKATRDTWAKAVLDVRSGATASVALNAKTYGMTYPERIGVEIGASLDTAAKKWRPVVKKITGHYSMRTRLLPGQAEITGPGGNTTKSNFCKQCTGLATLGNLSVATHPWYVLAAVVAHENVHLSRFLPGLVATEAAIATAVQAVTVPHTDPMTEADAIKALEADGAYQSAVARAYQIWLAECATRVGKDHDPGGPTDKAEQTVTEPLRKSICDHAKKEKWPACASC